MTIENYVKIRSLKDTQDEMYSALYVCHQNIPEELYNQVCKAMYIAIDEIQDQIDDVQHDKKIQL